MDRNRSEYEKSGSDRDKSDNQDGESRGRSVLLSDVSRAPADFSLESEDSRTGTEYEDKRKRSNGRLNEKTKATREGKDATFKSPAGRIRGTKIPEFVSKETTQSELGMTTEDWLNMDIFKLGTCALDNLLELDRQRRLCSNISGHVAGRMKDCKEVVSRITRVLIEKLEATGDVFNLNNRNFQLAEEVNILKHRLEVKDKERAEMMQHIAELQREVKSLKAGNGPFPARVALPDSPPDMRMEDWAALRINQMSWQSRGDGGDDLPLPLLLKL